MITEEAECFVCAQKKSRHPKMEGGILKRYGALIVSADVRLTLDIFFDIFFDNLLVIYMPSGLDEPNYLQRIPGSRCIFFAHHSERRYSTHRFTLAIHIIDSKDVGVTLQQGLNPSRLPPAETSPSSGGTANAAIVATDANAASSSTSFV